MPAVSSQNEVSYLNALRQIQEFGSPSDDRTNTGTTSLFGKVNCEFSLMDGQTPIVPLLSTKKVNFDAIKHELIWMLSGSQRLKYLKDNNVNIWDSWVLPGTAVYRELSVEERAAKLKGEQAERYAELESHLSLSGKSAEETERALCNMLDNWSCPKTTLADGDLGPVYGHQWRHFPDTRKVSKFEYEAAIFNWSDLEYEVEGESSCGQYLFLSREVDQIAKLEQSIKEKPSCRRMIVSAWNPAYTDEMALPPCHTLAQWRITKNARGVPVLDCKLYMRSSDFMLGVPFNIVFYSLLTHMLAATHNLEAGKMHLTVGDAHIYSNHIGQVELQLSRNIIESNQPRIQFKRGVSSILEFTADDIELDGYEHQAFIYAPVAV